MESTTGRWVVGDRFFGREGELRILETRVRGGNHVLLSGQRRMGKTSLTRELGRRLSEKDWVSVFADVERAASPEDVIADIAKAIYPHRSLARRCFSGLTRFVGGTLGRIEELGVTEFRVKVRAALSAETWRRHGEDLFSECAGFDRRVLLVVDELPIFLKRFLDGDGEREGVERFLSWLRATTLGIEGLSPVLLVSGSVGLGPLVRRLLIPDRINYLDPFHLGPWNRDDSIACFRELAKTGDLSCEEGVAGAVYDRLGLGIPHHVQSFFARLSEFATMRQRRTISRSDVDPVYRNGLLGPAGQNDLSHYRSRLEEGLDDEDYTLAMEILAEAATRGVFTAHARRELGRRYRDLTPGVPDRIRAVIEVLEHDGYLTRNDDGFRFESLLLRDWFSIRFRDNHHPLNSRSQAS